MAVKSTNLMYESLDDLAIGKEDNITDARLNETFTKLIKNDDSLAPVNTSEPQIWECRWWNVIYDKSASVDERKKYGYPKGQAFWYNTEDLDAFM
jgi:hypothetical protein